jgi:hypothetical protein
MKHPVFAPAAHLPTRLFCFPVLSLHEIPVMHSHFDKLRSAPRAIDGDSRRGLSFAPATAPLGLVAERNHDKHDAGRDDGR